MLDFITGIQDGSVNLNAIDRLEMPITIVRMSDLKYIAVNNAAALVHKRSREVSLNQEVLGFTVEKDMRANIRAFKEIDMYGSCSPLDKENYAQNGLRVCYKTYASKVSTPLGDVAICFLVDQAQNVIKKTVREDVFISKPHLIHNSDYFRLSLGA